MRPWAWIVSILPAALLVGMAAGGTDFHERIARADSLLSRRQTDASLQILDSLLIESGREHSDERKLRVLLTEARLHGIVGRPGPCRAAATDAHRIAFARRDTLAVCEAMRWLALAAQLQGNMAESRTWAHDLIDLARQQGDREHEAHGTLLQAYNDMCGGKLSSAEHGYERAVGLFKETGNLRFELMALTGLGRIRDSRGDVRGARSCYEEVLDGSRSLGDPFNEADALNNLGSLEFTFGDPSAARGFYQQALDLQIRNGNLSGSIVPAKNLAVICTYLGELDEAAGILEEARRRCDEMGYQGQKGMILEQLGIVRREQRRLEEACDLFRRAARLASDRSPEELGGILVDLAETLQYGDSLETGAAILRDRFGALRPLVSSELDFRAERVLGEILIRLGRLTEAKTHLRRADRLAREGGLGFRVAPLTYMARCHALEGRADSARICLHRAVDAWESERARLRDPTWREQLDLDGRFLHTEVAHVAFADAAPEPPAERCRFAFDAVQRFKARTLRERMLGAFAALRDSSAAASPGPVTLAELQERWLGPDEVLIDFFLGTDGVYLFGVTRTECRARRVLLDPDLLQTALRRYRDLVATQPGEGQGTSGADLLDVAGRRLSDLLLSPVADLIRTHERIIISPDGLLNMIPLESLPLPAAEGDPARPSPLFSWRRIARIPSASILGDQRSGAGSRSPIPHSRLLALLGEDGSSKTPIPGGHVEVRWLHSSFRNVQVHEISADTTAAAWAIDLSRSAVIHLASHVRVDDVHPWRSGLPSLRAHEVAEMRLPARLVVLAGCESAGGRVVSGEGVLGLTTAFTVATVPAVIATLWPISDRVTARFMKTFYTALARGTPVGVALRSAQLKTREDPATSSPFYWAGFVLVGDGDEIVRLDEKPTARIPRRLASAIAVLTGLAGIVWCVRRRSV